MDSGSPMRTSRLTRNTLMGWGTFAIVVVVATMLFGPLALMALLVSAGVALIVSGVRSKGWPRRLMIVAGALLVLLPILMFIDIATGSFTIVVR